MNDKATNFPGVRDGEVFRLGGVEFIKFPDQNDQTPAVMKNIALFSHFGENNNLSESAVLGRLHKEILPNIITEIGEENLCTIQTDLTALDGLKPYGVMKSFISLPTLDFYRANVEIFDRYKPDNWWWLATPESAQPHDDPNWVTCVAPSGCINYFLCDHDGCGVRPFLIFKSSIFDASDNGRE